MTAQARDGKIDPVTGVSMKSGTMTDILLRRRQNNPLLTGEGVGVGKTAVVEGFALAIAQGSAACAAGSTHAGAGRWRSVGRSQHERRV